MSMPNIGGRVAQAIDLNGPAQTLTVGATSNRTATHVAKKCKLLRLVCDTDCWVKVGDDTVEAAVNTTHMLLAGSEIYVSCTPGASHVAVIQDVAPGRLNIGEILE